MLYLVGFSYPYLNLCLNYFTDTCDPINGKWNVSPESPSIPLFFVGVTKFSVEIITYVITHLFIHFSHRYYLRIS